MARHSQNDHPPRGRVMLVGAGPGDPRYLTLRGAECIATADAVLYDYLVNPAMLNHARPTATLVCLGQHGRSRIWSQEEINSELVRLARAGQQVVRLKSGDPTVFARAAEELEALVAADVSYEIVPGVTSAIAVGSCAGIPLTYRDLSSAVALVTAHEDAGKADSTINYEDLAKFPGTLVFYMGVTTVSTWTSALIAGGKSAATPAAIVRRCSFPDQKTILCRLDEVAARMLEPRKIRPPVLVVVGEVAKLAERYTWFEDRPLFGQRVLVTRPAHQIEALAQPLALHGAEVIAQSAIEIRWPQELAPLDQAISRLAEFDWIVFSSANGVRFMLERIFALGQDARSLRGRIAAIGPGTAEELSRYHLRADLVPEIDFRAESLAASLADHAVGKRFLLIRASRGREVLAEELMRAGGEVQQVVTYESVDIVTPDAFIAEQLRDGHIDWVTVTSSAIARSLVAMFGADLHRAKLASISPITSGTLRELGYDIAAEASEYTMPGIVAAMLAQS